MGKTGRRYQDTLRPGSRSPMPGPASRRVGTDHALKHKRMEGNQTWYPAGTETVNWGGKYMQNKNEQKITVYGLNEESKLFYCGRTGLTDNTGWSHTIFDGDIYSKEIAARKLMYSPLGLIAPFAKTLRQRQQAGKR